MDVKIAFLNGNLIEDVYMTQQEGFVNPKNSRKVCKLLGVGIFILMKQSKHLDSSRMKMSFVFTKRLVGVQ